MTSIVFYPPLPQELTLRGFDHVSALSKRGIKVPISFQTQLRWLLCTSEHSVFPFSGLVETVVGAAAWLVGEEDP